MKKEVDEYEVIGRPYHLPDRVVAPGDTLAAREISEAALRRALGRGHLAPAVKSGKRGRASAKAAETATAEPEQTYTDQTTDVNETVAEAALEPGSFGGPGRQEDR